MTSFIAPISWGLGDLVVSLPAVQGLVGTRQPTWLVARSELQEGLAERIPGLAGVVPEEALSGRFCPQADVYYNLRRHPVQTDYWWGSPTFERDFPGWRINDILELICRDLRIPADFRRLVPLTYRHSAKFARTIVFFPGSDGQYKCWPQDNWLVLHNLLSKDGMSSVVIGQPERSPAVSGLVEKGLPWVPTPALTDALDVVSSSLAVVGVDTGLMHLAVHQGIPTVSLFRQGPIYQRTYDHTLALTGHACAPECVSRSLACANNEHTELSGWRARAWSCPLSDTERCLSSITPEAVSAALLSFLG